MRFTDFLKTAVLLFAAAGTALAAVALAAANARDDRTLLLVGFGWWAVAAAIGLWLGRRGAPTPGIERLLAGARMSSSLPEVEPGTILFNRLWALAAVTVVAGGLAFVFPQVPAVAAGYAILCALAWRKQHRAVQAIEGRDGGRLYV